MPKTIAIDMDEVLAAFVPAICKYHNEKYGTDFQLKDFFSYRFSDVWGGSDEQATEKVHDFFKTKHFKEISVVRGACQGVASLKKQGYKLIVVTSRQLVIQDESRKWLFKNFPENTFAKIEFGNHWGKSGEKKNKLDLCREHGACALIDDSLSYTTEVAQAGMHALLFDLDGSYPWNRSDNLGYGVTRVTNWDMAVKKITEQIPN